MAMNNYGNIVSNAPVPSGDSINPDYSNILKDDYKTEASVNEAPLSDNEVEVLQGRATHVGTSNTDGPAVLDYLSAKIASLPTSSVTSGNNTESEGANTLTMDTVAIGSRTAGYNSGTLFLLGGTTSTSTPISVSYTGYYINEGYSGIVDRTYAKQVTDNYQNYYNITGASAYNLVISGFGNVNLSSHLNCNSGLTATSFKMVSPASTSIAQLASTAALTDVITALNTLLTVLDNSYNLVSTK